MDDPTRYQFGDISGNIKLPTHFLNNYDSSRSNPRKKSDNNSNTLSSSGRQFVLVPPPTQTHSNKFKTKLLSNNRVPPIQNLIESDDALYKTLTDSQRSYLNEVWNRLSNTDGVSDVTRTLKIITNDPTDNPQYINYKKYVHILLKRLDNSKRDLSSSTVSTNTPASSNIINKPIKNTGESKQATTSIESKITQTPNGPSNQASVVPPEVASNVLKRLNGSEEPQNQTPNL
jgi:hypothetical protein